jgi:hypothetical protein
MKGNERHCGININNERHWGGVNIKKTKGTGGVKKI